MMMVMVSIDVDMAMMTYLQRLLYGGCDHHLEDY
eukprot:SAG25_NODE_187_length_12399_cov_42.588537_6_plen_34_part_00